MIESELIHIYCGTDLWQQATNAEVAFEEAIRERTTGDVRIHWMRQGDTWNWGGWSWDWATPFSLFRWMVPDFAVRAEHGRRAIYMDVDQLALADLRELWAMDLQGKPAAWAGRADCILFDVEPCVALYSGPFPEQETDVPGVMAVGDRQEVSKYLKTFRQAVTRNHFQLGEAWNQIDKADKQTKILHFTELRGQPWKPYRVGVLEQDPGRLLEYHDHPDMTAVLLWEYYEARGCRRYDRRTNAEHAAAARLILPPGDSNP